MHLIALSLAFAAVVRAAPVSYSRDQANSLARRDDEPYSEFSGAAEFDVDERDDYFSEYPEYDESGDGASRYLSNEDDPAFAAIFQHIEDILYSASTPEDQLDHIVDAIVHHQESLQEPEKRRPSSDEIVFHMFKILDSDSKSSDDKIEEIFAEILDNTKHAQLIELDDPAGAVLYRIRWMLEEPMSAQKRVQMILNELADHLHPEQAEYGPSLEDSQEAFQDAGHANFMATIEDDAAADVAAFDIEEDAEDDYWQRHSLEEAGTDQL